MNLLQYGLNTSLTNQLQQLQQEGLFTNTIIGRISLEHKHSYRVATEEGELLASISGNFAHNAYMRKDYPAIGDWVLLTKLPNEQKGVIHKILDRTSIFSRKMAGLELDEQIVATNIDIIFIATSLNDDFNIRRIERYITAAWNCGATPVIILTKKDLCEHVEKYVDEIAAISLGIDIIPISVWTSEGIPTVRNMLQPNLTAALIGSSGVGKSTLTNALIGKNEMAVQSIREDDARGRHTTTHRELFTLPTGGVIIDTPGMREMQLWNDHDALEGSFSDIETLALSCKFRDCTHENQLGCAITKAIDHGLLDKKRLHHYFKLQREIAYIEQKTTLQTTKVKNKRNKQTKKKSY